MPGDNEIPCVLGRVTRSERFPGVPVRVAVEEDRGGAHDQPERAPRVLHQKALQHVVRNFRAKVRGHVCHEAAEIADQLLLLEIMATVEGNFFGVGDYSAMGAAQGTLQLGASLDELPKWWREELKQLGRDHDHDASSPQRLFAHTSIKIRSEYNNVEQRLRDVGVQVRQQ